MTPSRSKLRKEEELREFQAMVEDHRDRLERACREELAMDQVLVVAAEPPEMFKRWRVDNTIGALAVTTKSLRSLASLMTRDVFDEDDDRDMALMPSAERFLRLYEIDPSRTRFVPLVRQAASAWNPKAPDMRDIFLVEEVDNRSTSQLQIPRPRNLSEAVKLSQQLQQARARDD